MGRQSLKHFDKLRACFYYAVVKSKSKLSDAKMDMLFCDQAFLRNYYDRRRIFNRLKLGYMPYRDVHREDFLKRVSEYPSLEFTADIYNSFYWNLTEPYSFEQNSLLMIGCIKKLNIFSGKEFNALFTKFLSITNNTSQTSSIDIQLEDVEMDSESYGDLLNNLLETHPYNLDALTFVATLYRESVAKGHLKIAQILRFKYATLLTTIFIYFRIDKLLQQELIDHSKNHILNIVETNNLRVLDIFEMEAAKSDDTLNILLKAILTFH